jgi:hypothetical protein
MLGLQKGRRPSDEVRFSRIGLEVCIKRAGTPLTASRLISAT